MLKSDLFEGFSRSDIAQKLLGTMNKGAYVIRARG